MSYQAFSSCHTMQPLETPSAVLPLPDYTLLPYVDHALQEDIGRRGDLTTQVTIPASTTATFQLVARQAGVVCGLALARLAFHRLDAQLQFQSLVVDGQAVHSGQVLATVSGAAWPLLAAERTALNFMTHLSGIATQTAHAVAQVAGTGAQITCSRKTLPGLRVLQKYAVRCGGGRNHRMGLDDAILIKDNHLAYAGSIEQAVHQARALAGHLIPIEIEVDTLDQLAQALDAGADFILLDNMDDATLAQAVAMCQGRARTEASGGIRADRLRAIAALGVDYIALGYLTHSSIALDIGLDALS